MKDVESPIRTDRLCLRRYGPDDVAPLVAIANNANVSQYLTDRFPYPYTNSDAENWVRLRIQEAEPCSSFAIEFEGTLIGGVGLERLSDVHRLSAEVGYWLGEPHWGRGFATEALDAFTAYALRTFDFVRLQASVYEWNESSMRVLEKCGYVREARLRSAIVKRGRIGDSFIYSKIRT